MAKLSVKNAKEASPPWMVNTTGALTAVVAVLTTMVNTMPAGVPASVKEWILWSINGIAGIATIFAGATIFAKRSDLVGGRDKDDR